MRNINKIKASALVGVLGLAGLGSAFAYFASESKAKAQGRVGTVELAVRPLLKDGGLDTQNTQPVLKHYDANGDESSGTVLNPGDNDPDSPQTPGVNDPADPNYKRNGTDHEIYFKLENDGNKSILTRTIIKVQGTSTKGDALTEAQLENIVLSTEDAQFAAGSSANHANNAQLVKLVKEGGLTGSDAANTIMYMITDSKPLNGIDKGDGGAPEIEADGVAQIVRKINVGMKGALTEVVVGVVADANELATKYPNAPVAADKYYLDSTSGKFYACTGAGQFEEVSILSGADIVITLEHQAMQYRNTKDGDWATIFSQTFHVGN